MVISWKPPEDDGGAMITNYIIEKREAKEGAEWELVSSSISGTTCRIVNLTENAGYYFRVSAQNTYGISEALEVSSVVVMKPPFGKCTPKYPVRYASVTSKASSLQRLNLFILYRKTRTTWSASGKCCHKRFLCCLMEATCE